MAPKQRVFLTWFLCVAAVACAYAIWAVAGLPWRARVFPQTVATIGLVLSILAFFRAAHDKDRAATEGASPPSDSSTQQLPDRGIKYLLWVAGYLVAIAMAGFPAASTLWVSFFLRYEDRMPMRLSIAAGAAVAVAMVLLDRIVQMPAGWMFS